MSAAGIRRPGPLARRRPQGRRQRYQRPRRPGADGDPTEAPARPGEGPLHGEELRGGVVVLLGRGLHRRWRRRAGEAPRERSPPTTVRRGGRTRPDDDLSPRPMRSGPRRPRPECSAALGQRRSHQGRRSQGPEYHRVPVPLTRLDLRGVPADELAAALPRPAVEETFPSDAVRAVLDEVRAGGDDAVRALTRRFDGVDIDTLRVPADDLDRGPRAGLDPGAAGRARAGLRRGSSPTTATSRARSPDFENDGVVVRHLRAARGPGRAVRPGGPGALSLDRAHVRRPGPGGRRGRAGAVRPARPRRRHRGRDPGRRGHRRHRRGLPRGRRPGHGGHGVRHASRSGPSTSSPGPGNRYVAEAKRQVSGIVGVPSAFAGPSEVVVVADDATPVAWAAIDVVVQAEHGPDGLAWLVTWSPSAGRRHRGRGRQAGGGLAPARRPRGHACARGGYVALGGRARRRRWPSPTWWRPSTWSCSSRTPRRCSPWCERAGAVFLGPYAPASVGDYVAGPNHVLPTARTARFASALRVDDFRTHIHAVSMDAATLARLAPHVAAIAAGRGAPARTPESVVVRGEP